MNTSKLSRKDKIGITLIVLILVGFAMWCFWLGISGLFLSDTHPLDHVFGRPIKGDRYDGQITYVSNYREKYNHYINHRWAGVEYYYIIFSEDRSKAIVVRSTKQWGSNFGNDFYNKVSLQSNGIAKKLRYKVKKKMSQSFADMKEQGIQVETDIYLDLLAKKICWMQLFVGISLLSCIIYCFLLYKNAVRPDPKPIPKGLTIAMIILFLITALVLLYLRNKT